MSDKIAIIAALPREISSLVRGIPPDPELKRQGIHLHRLKCGVAVAAGMGAERASIAVQAALASSEIGMLVSAGLAGGCVPGVAAGSVLEANIVVDAMTGERFPSSGLAEPKQNVVLATIETIASVREKARLFASYGAMLVDMEAATVARLARANGLVFRAIKGVSDAYDFEMQSLARFAGDRGSFRTAAFAVHTASRPWEWKRAMELGRGSSRALVALDRKLRVAMRMP